MKNRILTQLICLLLVCANSFAQTPEAFNYQAVIRNAQGNVIANSNEQFKFEIHKTTVSGTVIYSEEQTGTSNGFGLVNFQIGRGTNPSVGFSTINWNSGPYFLEIKRMVNGSYESLGTQELISVPFAMQAKKLSLPYEENIQGNDNYFGSKLSFTDISTNTFSSDISFAKFISDNRPPLELESINKTGLKVLSYNAEGAVIQSALNKPAVFARTLGNTNTMHLEGNSGGNNSQLLLAESEDDYARLSFISNYLYATGGQTSNLWTLAAKTDANNSNARLHFFKTGTGNILSLSGDGNVGIGTADPTSKLEVAGQLKITGGGPGQGKVLTSDANGLASWQTPTGGGTGNFSLPYNSGTLNYTSVPLFSVTNSDADGLEGISSYFNGVGVRGVNTFSGPLSSQTVGVLGVTSNGCAIKGTVSGTGSPTGTAGYFYAPSSGAAIQTVGLSSFSKSQNPFTPTAAVDIDGELRLRAQQTPALITAGLIWFDGTNFKGNNGTTTITFGSGGGTGSTDWTTTTGGIYNTSLSNVGIGTNAPYAKLHVEGGQVFIKNNINGGLRVNNTGSNVSAVEFQASSGTGLSVLAQTGIDVQATDIGITGVSVATSGGKGIYGVSYSGTGTAIEASNTHYSGMAFKVSSGGVSDTGGKWSFKVYPNSIDLSQIYISYPNPSINDMLYIQSIGTGNGAINYILEWDGINNNWRLTTNSGNFDPGLAFNVMVIHAN
ncbi:MAG: hypothetical protein K1X82_10040 [Bacteroidia bacterium]|nr:hypothetical protein [Bacteroidia bacterium]